MRVLLNRYIVHTLAPYFFPTCWTSTQAYLQIIGKTKSNAEEYLNRHVHDIHEPYVAALVAYALSLGNNPEKHTAMDVMKDELLYDHSKLERLLGGAYL